MDDDDFFASRFEEHRGRLRAVAYRMLGSLAEAEDAVQETWIKAARADTSGVENLAAWLTTVVGRVCLNMLQSRTSRRENAINGEEPRPAVHLRRPDDPEAVAVIADEVGLAMLVVLDTLSPTQRLAFVLHDLFGVPFADIAPIIERSPETTQRIASRARQRVRGGSVAGEGDRTRRYRAVEAFLRAAQNGEFEDLLALLDPDVTYRPDEAARLLGAGTDLVGAVTIAGQFAEHAHVAAPWLAPILLDGEPGAVLAPLGRLRLVFTVDFDGDRIAGIRAVAEPERLATMAFAVGGSSDAVGEA